MLVGIAPVKQERLLRSCPPVIVATPGRLWDLIQHGHKHVSALEHLSFFVLDEADRMVQQVGDCCLSCCALCAPPSIHW
jgi:ATP-dependent RNA helicase DDX24/MAK5